MAAAVVVVVLLASWGGCVWRANAQLRAAIDAARAAGYPMTIEEMATFHPPPEGPNPADWYQRAAGRMVNEPTVINDLPHIGSAKPPPAGADWPDTWLDLLRQHLDSNAAALELIYEASTMGPAWYDRGWENSPDLSMAGYNEMRRATNLLRLHAVLLRHEGRLDDATDAVVAMFRVSDALRDEPLLMSFVTRVGLIGAPIRATEDLLAGTELSEAQLVRLQDAAATDDGTRDAVRAVVGSRLWGHIAAERNAASSRVPSSSRHCAGPVAPSANTPASCDAQPRR